MGNRLVAFAAGFGKGMLDTQRQMELDKERQEDRKMRADEFALRQQDLQNRLDREAEEKNDRIALRDAGKPATVSEAGALPDGLQYASNEDADAAAAGQPNAPMPEVPRFRVESGTGAQRYGSRQEAEAAAAKHNDPIALSNRVATTLRSQGKFTEAMQHEQAAQKFADERWDRDLRDAMTRGHQGIAEFMTNSQGGVLKGKTIKPVTSEDGKSVTYHIVNPDGTTTATPYTLPNDENGVVTAAYQLSRISPETRYKHMVEADKARWQRETKDKELTLREEMLNKVQIPVAEARAAAAEARLSAGTRKGADTVSREERLRWTSLHSESGRRLSEANKALSTLQRDPVFMAKASKAGSAEAQQLADLKGDIDSYKQDREMYGSLLAGSQGEKARAERDAGSAPPAVGSGKAAGTAAAGKPGSSRDNPIPVSDRAARDKLPKGAYYRAPNGDVYIKQ